MTPLTTITGLPAETADLMAEAGIRSTRELAREKPARLHARLELIAWQRGRGSHAPPLDQLEHWVSVAGMVTPKEEAEVLNVDDIPEAVVIPESHQTRRTPSLRAAGAATGVTPAGSDPENVRQQTSVPQNPRRRVEPANFHTIEAYNKGRTSVPPLSRDSLEPRPETAAPSDAESDNAAHRRAQRLRSSGQDLSRWVRRGVVHPRPIHTWCGALVSFVWRVAFVAGIAGFIYLIVWLEATQYKTEVIAGSVIMAVLGLLQLHFAGRSRCRICSCNLFYSKNCLKNRKAHHIPMLGYVASLSLHLLIFGWFRCMYCGTAIRLKPSPPRRVEPE